MDLWIRSKDKEDLVKVDNLGLAYKGKYNFVDNDIIDDKYYICQFVEDHHFNLGAYKTKERALEVLDDIQNKLKIICTDSTGGEYILAKNLIPIIYEMPKE